MKTAIRINAEIWTDSNAWAALILHPEDGRVLMYSDGNNPMEVVEDDVIHSMDDYPKLSFSGNVDVEVDLSGYIPVVNPMTPRAAAMNYFFSAAVYNLQDEDDTCFATRPSDLASKWISEGRFHERTRNLIEYLLRSRGLVC